MGIGKPLLLDKWDRSSKVQGLTLLFYYNCCEFRSSIN